MSTFDTHQQSLADASSETRPSMLERGSYIPWESHFRRYLNRKRENRKWFNKEINEGPYEFRIFTPSETEAPRMQKEEDLRGDDLKHYEAEIEAMNLILISIPNDIYNSMDACTTAKAMWQRVERLMRGTVQNKVNRETHLNNEFDQFVAERGEALVSVYNHFAQLINDLERNGIIFPKFKKLVNASRAKKLEKSHDPLALVAHTGSSSRTTTPYYVTNLSSVVDYDDDYQGDVVQNNSEDPLTSAIILLARAITQCFSNPTNNRLRTSFNTRNQTIFQGTTINVQCYNCSKKGHYACNCTKLRVRDLKHFMEQMLLAKQDEAGVILTDEQNDFLFTDASRMEEIKELSTNICLMARIQPTNIYSDARPSYNSTFLSEVQTPSTSYVNPLFSKDNQEQKYSKQPKIINNTIGDDQIDSNIIFNKPNRDVNNGSIVYDNNVQESYALEQLARNAYKEAEKQQIIAKKAGRKAKQFAQESQSQFIHDRDVIQDLEQQRDKLELSVVELKRQIVELQKTQSILKCKMSENEDQYHDIVLDLKVRAKNNEHVVLKTGDSLQGMFLLGPKLMSFNDSKVKHGLGYTNPYTLIAISQNPKLYDASCLDDSKNPMHVRDTKDILDDATKSQIKMKNKMKDRIAIEKK
ncbi:retrovirus-related pol polyprotein from transposon TNT 1-94 [Tanacetum coccineum]